ncbi:phage tail protein [Cupriavidus pauculus]|uniref:Phage tail protein n=2 Tax=Cupriavidus pauculus TaxID=82633 RepID=A0A2N5C498_9BURK|nr:phage tail protein [Cupriavidus pauculus]
MSVTAASPTATLAADEIVVETSLGGLRYCLSNFSRTINLATTGVGGMDVGSAPVSGYVALYAIYNPSNGAMGLLAVNATGAVAPNIYAGANMPVGYTASALVSAWQTNGSGQFVAGLQIDRRIGVADNSVLTTSSTVATPQALSIASAVPPNAKFCSGTLVCNNTVPSLSGTMSLSVYDSDANTGGQSIVGAAVGLRVPFSRVAINTPQTIRWSSANNSGSPTFIIVISSYEI